MCCFLGDLLWTNSPGSASQWDFRNNPMSLQKGPEEAGSQNEGMSWYLHGAQGASLGLSYVQQTTAQRGNYEGGQDMSGQQYSPLHKEESLSSQVPGTSTWWELRTGSRLREWGRGRQVKRPRQTEFWEKSPPWDESPTFQAVFLPQTRSYSELQHVKQENYRGWRCGVESG